MPVCLRPALAVLAALLLVPAAAHAAPKPKASSTGGGFTKLAVHPQAAAQPTAMGRTIATITGFEGEVYTGYGDYGANTGPIAISPYSGSTFAAPRLQADTEAVWLYRKIGGRLYAPSIDPRASADFAIGTSTGGLASWTNAAPFAATHVLDVTTLTGTDLWAVGSSGVDAVAWRSLDGGATWAEARRVAPVTAGDYARFYGAGVVGGRLYLQAWSAATGLHPATDVYDGSTWSQQGSIGYVFNHAEQVAGRMLAHGTFHAAHYSGPLVSFDGTRATAVIQNVWDYTVDGSTVYALGMDRVVRASQDLRTWTQVATAPSVARSIGVANGAVYVGGTDSALYVKR